jgi:hypothetical protein
MTSKDEQEEIDLALDAALDELDGDDEEQPPKYANNELTATEPLCQQRQCWGFNRGLNEEFEEQMPITKQ